MYLQRAIWAAWVATGASVVGVITNLVAGDLGTAAWAGVAALAFVWVATTMRGWQVDRRLVWQLTHPDDQ